MHRLDLQVAGPAKLEYLSGKNLDPIGVVKKPRFKSIHAL